MFTTLRSKILAGFAAVIAINVVFGLWAIFQFSQVGESATDAIATNYELITNTVQLGFLADKQLGLLQQILNAFDQVRGSFQYLVNSWTTVVELLSIYKRLRTFEAAIDGEPLPLMETTDLRQPIL